MTHRVPLALSALILLSACGQEEVAPLTSATVRSSLRDNARTHARDGAQMIADFLQGGFADLAYEEICAATSDVPEEECAPPELDFEAADADEVVDELVDTFFADDRVVSETATEVIYSIDANDVCDTDAECIDAITELALQLVASQPSLGSIQIILRSGTHNVFVLELDANRASVEVDLGGLRGVVADHPALFDIDPQDIPLAAGRVRATIERSSARHYLAELAVTQDVAIQHANSEGMFELEIDAATILSIDADADTESLVATIGLDRTSATFPASMLERFFEAPIQGVAHLELGGLTASADLANLEQRLVISGLGLGQTTSSLSLDGVDLFTLDLNEAFGRELTLDIQALNEQFELTFDPAITVASDLFLQPLADQGHQIPAWMLDSSNELGFTGAQGSPVLSIGEARAEVVNGTLSLSSSEIAAPISIDAGMCIAVDDSIDPQQVHPFAAISSATCE